MTVGTAVMSWAAPMKPAVVTNSPALTEPASPLPSPAMERATAWMARMRQTSCASLLSQPVHHSSTCAIRASVSMPAGFVMGRRTARTTVTKKAVVRYDVDDLFENSNLELSG